MVNVRWLDELRRDTIHALRTLGGSPAFTIIAIVTLSLAIGSNAAVFTVVDHVVLRPLAAPDADRLVGLYSSSPGRPKNAVSMDDVADWRRGASSFDLLTAFGGTSFTIEGAAGPQLVVGMLVGPDFFTLTGVRMPLGRPFAGPEYESPANAALATFAPGASVQRPASIILSDRLWRSQFGADPQVVGRHLRLNNQDAIVAGVMPADLRFTETRWGPADCWVPLVEARLLGHRRMRQLTAVGRMKAGVSVSSAAAEMDVIGRSLQQAFPQDDGQWSVVVEPLKESKIADVRPTLLILFGGVGCVLLVACANIASLLVVRAAGRRREVAVRVAIGAGRGRLVRQWLTESTTLALAGGAGGLLLTVWAVPALTALAPKSLPRLAEIAVDGRTALACVALALAAGVVCGVAPAIGLGRLDPAMLRSAAVVGRAQRRWLRPALVMVQVGLAVILLVGAGLMARSYVALRALDLGFDPRNVLTFGVTLLRNPRYGSPAASREFVRDLTSRLSAMPGVVTAGTGMVPLLGGLSSGAEIEGRRGKIETGLDVGSAGYLSALGFRLRAGRFFAEADDARGEPVAIVNREFARMAWARDDAVGRRVRVSGEQVWRSVVGVVDNTRHSSLEAPPPPAVYLPHLQTTVIMPTMFVVRTSGPPMGVLSAARDAVRGIDPTVPMTDVATMDERVAKYVAPREFNLWLVGLFSLLAFVLAVVGLYGLVNELVVERTPEIGLRMALGADRLGIMRLIVGGSLAVTAAGVLIGLVGAAAATRSLGAMIFGVRPLDPATFLLVPAALLIAGLVAAAAPTVRAMAIDPVSALRRE